MSKTPDKQEAKRKKIKSILNELKEAADNQRAQDICRDDQNEKIIRSLHAAIITIEINDDSHEMIAVAYLKNLLEGNKINKDIISSYFNIESKKMNAAIDAISEDIIEAASTNPLPSRKHKKIYKAALNRDLEKKLQL